MGMSAQGYLGGEKKDGGNKLKTSEASIFFEEGIGIGENFFIPFKKA